MSDAEFEDEHDKATREFERRASEAYRRGDFAAEDRIISEQVAYDKKYFKARDARRAGKSVHQPGGGVCLILCLGMLAVPALLLASLAALLG